MKQKVNHAISNNEPLLCIGFQLHDFSLSDLSISKEFTIPVYFSGSDFFGYADFGAANFQGGAELLHNPMRINIFEINHLKALE
jgi:hypothetical protein